MENLFSLVVAGEKTFLGLSANFFYETPVKILLFFPKVFRLFHIAPRLLKG